MHRYGIYMAMHCCVTYIVGGTQTNMKHKCHGNPITPSNINVPIWKYKYILSETCSIFPTIDRSCRTWLSPQNSSSRYPGVHSVDGARVASFPAELSLCHDIRDFTPDSSVTQNVHPLFKFRNIKPSPAHLFCDESHAVVHTVA